MTPDELRELAIDTIAEWACGWTYPEEGPQEHLHWTLIDDDALIVAVGPDQYTNEKSFTVEVRVTEVTE